MSTELEKVLAEVAGMRGYMRGKLDATASDLREDQTLRELLRVQSWVRSDGAITSLDRVPAGWPEGVDGDEIVNETVEARMRPLYEEGEAAAPADNDSAFTRAFRKGVNDA
ncbi:MAG: hypothetical protein WD795_17040 [Woeseia sp.]